MSKTQGIRLEKGVVVELIDRELNAEEIDFQPTPEQQDAQAKADSVQEARSDGTKILLELVAPYSEEEWGTWFTQESEAREWLVDNESPCIMIRRIAYHREITVAVMVEKIMDNVELFKYVAGDILGVQQKTIDDIELAAAL